jgi:hypothetical protein
MVTNLTTPDQVVEIAPIDPPDAEAIATGRTTYFELSCDHCHGVDGTGEPDMLVLDEKGSLTRPRDLVHEPLKGGDDPGSICLRIAVGMPGSPHPATWGLSEERLTDLVHFCRSLAAEPKLVLTNYQHCILTTSSAYLSELGRLLSP